MNIAEFLKGENIFEYALLPVSALRITDPRRVERMGFRPKSAVIFLMPYYLKEEKGNISRYSKSRDYHLFIKELESRAREVFDINFACFSDTSPIDEVGAALCANLGCVGESGLIINKRYGSYVFIGEFFFDKSVDDEFFNGIEEKHSPQKCLGCGACKRCCPTGGIYDRTKCVSCINQKKKITDEEAKIIKESGSVWGCDICQEVCPINQPEETPIPFFRENRINSLDMETLENLIRDKEFEKRAFAWRGEGVVRRNIEILKSE